MKRMQDEFKKRMDGTARSKSSSKMHSSSSSATNENEDDRRRSNTSKSKTSKAEEEEAVKQLVVQMAVKAGLLIVAGLSLCFSSFLIPGVVPFLGGLFCGVALIEPPPVPGTEPSKQRDNMVGKKKYQGGQEATVIKRMLINMIDLLF